VRERTAYGYEMRPHRLPRNRQEPLRDFRDAACIFANFRIAHVRKPLYSDIPILGNGDQAIFGAFQAEFNCFTHGDHNVAQAVAAENDSRISSKLAAFARRAA